MDLLELFKVLGPVGIYLFGIGVLWNRLTVTQDSCAKKVDEILLRYEVLLTKNIEALTRLAERLEADDEPR